MLNIKNLVWGLTWWQGGCECYKLLLSGDLEKRLFQLLLDGGRVLNVVVACELGDLVVLRYKKSDSSEQEVIAVVKNQLQADVVYLDRDKSEDEVYEYKFVALGV